MGVEVRFKWPFKKIIHLIHPLKVDEWMDEWISGWMHEWMDGCMDAWMDEWMGG